MSFSCPRVQRRHIRVVPAEACAAEHVRLFALVGLAVRQAIEGCAVEFRNLMACGTGVAPKRCHTDFNYLGDHTAMHRSEKICWEGSALMRRSHSEKHMILVRRYTRRGQGTDQVIYRVVRRNCCVVRADDLVLERDGYDVGAVVHDVSACERTTHTE